MKELAAKLSIGHGCEGANWLSGIQNLCPYDFNGNIKVSQGSAGSRRDAAIAGLIPQRWSAKVSTPPGDHL